MTMNKTSVYLTDDERDRLAFLARREGRPRAEIIRAAIRAYEAVGDDVPEWEFEGSEAIEGLNARDLTDEELLRGFGES